MAANLTPLVGTYPTRKGDQPQVGELVTVTLFGGKQSSARLERVEASTYFVKLVGLEVPSPYQLGDRLPLSREAVVDW